MVDQNVVQEDEIDLRELVVTFKQNFYQILFITLAVVVGTGAYLYFMPPVYTSSVTIALDRQEKMTMEAILPSQLMGELENDERLQLAKVTLQSKKFVDTIIDKVPMDKTYYIRKNFRKSEVNAFSDLQVDISLFDQNLYGEFFKIVPYQENSFLVEVEDEETEYLYSEVHQYNEEITNEYFSLRVIKNEGEDPFVGSLESTLYGSINNGLGIIDSRAYFFKVYDRDTQKDIIIDNMAVSDLSDNILHITYSDSIPLRAKVIAEEIARSYIDYDLENKTAELEQTLQFLDKQIVEVENSLKSKGEKLKAYQKKNTTVAVMDSPSNILDIVEEKSDSVERVQLQIQEIKNFRATFQSGVMSTVSLVSAGIDTSSIQSLIETYRVNDEQIRALRFQQSDIGKSVTDNMQINSLINELKTTEQELQGLRNNFTDEHPQVIQVRRNLSETESKIHSYIVANLNKLQKDKAIAKSAILNNMLMVQKNLENKLRLLRSDIRQKRELLSSLPAKNLVNQDLKRNFALSEEVYTFLLQKKIEVEISKASMIANTKIIEDAEIADLPIKPKKMMIMLVGLILGLILGVAYVLLREFFDTKLRTVVDIEKQTHVPLYGTLPLKSNERFFKEALRNVRTNLQFVLSENKNCTTILISSTVTGEGKTTVTAGLGEVIASAGKRVLLLDLDLRKPRLHKELKQSNKMGMSNYLSGNIDIHEHIIPLSDNLDFFSAGTIPPNPSELLMSEKFNQLISRLEEEYDYILFDTAPIGSVTDANMILKHSDIVLLILRANEAERIYLKHFEKMITDKHIKSAGVILNGVKLYKSKTYGYGYGYGYGYNYGYGDKKEES